jgi:phosphatidylinositol alpha-1,6-mannosyltransferase
VLGIAEPPGHSVVDDVTYWHLLPRGDMLLERLAYDEYTELSTQVLADFVARERPALLHVASGRRGFDTALTGNAVARWAGIPWVYEVRGFSATTWTQIRRYADQGEYHDRRFATETRMMRAADLVLTLSEPMRDDIAETRGISPDKIRVVPNAVDVDRFTPQPRSPELRARLGLENSTTIGYVSNAREGQAALLKAIASLRAQGRSVTGLLVGDVKQRAQLEKVAADLEIAPSIVFTGSIPIDEMAAYYAQMDVFVGPLGNERPAPMMSPMTPLEAMAMDVPVLVADLPGFAEIVDDGLRAHSFRAGDAESLAAEVARLVDAPQKMRRLTADAGEWVRRERSLSSVATALDDAYAMVLSRHAGTSVRGSAAC